MDRVWYLAYGSNINTDRLRAYVPDSETDGRYSQGLDTDWVQMDGRRLYFAGTSKTWGGAVAFCSLVPQPAHVCQSKAYGVYLPDLALVVAKENGLQQIGWDPGTSTLEIGSWLPLPVALAADGFRGKYNALLRLPDLHGVPRAPSPPHASCRLAIRHRNMPS